MEHRQATNNHRTWPRSSTTIVLACTFGAGVAAGLFGARIAAAAHGGTAPLHDDVRAEPADHAGVTQGSPSHDRPHVGDDAVMFSTAPLFPASIPEAGSSRTADETAADRQEKADTLVDQLTVRIRSSAPGAAARGVTAEDLAGEQTYYIDGWVDSVVTLSEDALPELSHSIEEAMCGSQSDGEAIMLSRLAARIPQLATTRGLGCILQQEQTEGVVLANALDAYRQAGLPPSDAWETWRERAATPEIRARFLPLGVDPPERVAERGGTQVHAGHDGRASRE